MEAEKFEASNRLKAARLEAARLERESIQISEVVDEDSEEDSKKQTKTSKDVVDDILEGNNKEALEELASLLYERIMGNKAAEQGSSISVDEEQSEEEQIEGSEEE